MDVAQPSREAPPWIERARASDPSSATGSVGPEDVRSVRRLSGKANARVGLSIGAGLVALGALTLSGAVSGLRTAFVEMGFDPDRAMLIAALVAAATMTATATLTAGRRRTSSLVGIVGFGAVFGRTLLDETANALAARPDQGAFDPVGWIVTVVALGAAAGLVAWIVATVALDIRRGALASWSSSRAWLAGRRPPMASRWSPLGVIAIAVLMAVALPAFADMVNYSPDALMRRGAPTHIGLVPASPVESAAATAGAVANERPWLAWLPTGSGVVVPANLPAPWTGGTSDRITVAVYLPPGYATDPARRYPTIYIPPWWFPHWQASIGVGRQLDALMTSGRIPASIVVFISQAGSPFPASECADSFDGRQHLDSWIAGTLIAWVDGRYRTIADRRARSLIGYSEGGYCVAALLLRHPDVFGQAAAMSGYYVAGPHDGQTVNAWRVFGDNARAKADASPMLLVDRMDQATRQTIFMVLNGQPTEPFYGAQYRAFAEKLAVSQVPFALLPAGGTGHSWQEVRTNFSAMLALLAGHQVVTGVFPDGRTAPPDQSRGRVLDRTADASMRGARPGRRGRPDEQLNRTTNALASR